MQHIPKSECTGLNLETFQRWYEQATKDCEFENGVEGLVPERHWKNLAYKIDGVRSREVKKDACVALHTPAHNSPQQITKLIEFGTQQRRWN